MIELWVSPRGYHPWGYLADYVDAGRVIQVGAMPQNGRHPVWRLYPKVRCHLGVVPFRPFLDPFGPGRAKMVPKRTKRANCNTCNTIGLNRSK